MTNHKSANSEVHTTVRVPLEVHERLRELAAKEHRTVSAEVRKVLIEHVAANVEDVAA